MPLNFYRQNPDTATITFPAGTYDTTAASLMLVIKTSENAKTLDPDDDLAVVKKTVAIPSNVTSVDVPLTKTDLTIDVGRYVCGAKLFLLDGTMVPIELRDPSVVISYATVQDTTL